jgi:hypothetical protein
VWQGGGVLFLALKMSQNSIDDVLVFDATVRRQDAVVTGEIDPRLWYQSSQPRIEIYRVEGYLGRSIPVGRLQGVDHLAGGAQ